MSGKPTLRGRLVAVLVHELRRGGFDPAGKRVETEDGVTRTRRTKWGMKNAILGRCAPHDYGLRFTR